MEHEVFVPVPAERLREVLADPVRVARAVPGLQQDAGAEPVTGRLKVRVGGHTITYRGSARLSAQDDGSYAVEGDATEARGTGAVKLALTLRVDEAEGGSKLTFDGTASADGRVTELPAEAVTSAATRLLNRFAEHLGNAASEPTRKTRVGEEPGATEPGETAEPAADEAGEAAEGPPTEATEPSATDVTEPSAGEDTEPRATGDTEDSGPSETGAATGDFEAAPAAEDAPVPAEPPAPEPPAPEPSAEDAPLPTERPATPDDYTGTPDLPAEAAHARRTMIGRSAEEVDHAPPRGRYAPVPAPQTIASRSTLRWAAPAAALVVASAIVVGRALRRRR